MIPVKSYTLRCSALFFSQRSPGEGSGFIYAQLVGNHFISISDSALPRRDQIFKPEASSSRASRFKMSILFLFTSMIPFAFILAKVLDRVSLIVPNFDAS
jgi:hypothetical protein